MYTEEQMDQEEQIDPDYLDLSELDDDELLPQTLSLIVAIQEAQAWIQQALEQFPDPVPSCLQEYPKWFEFADDTLSNIRDEMDSDVALRECRAYADHHCYDSIDDVMTLIPEGCDLWSELEDEELSEAITHICSYWTQGLDRLLYQVQMTMSGAG